MIKKKGKKVLPWEIIMQKEERKIIIELFVELFYHDSHLSSPR